MKWLTVILIMACILNVGAAHAEECFGLSNIFTLDTRAVPSSGGGLEHSALSNIFTLDTRDAPTTGGGLEHSALSNIFTLDTRDVPTTGGGLEHSALSNIFTLDTLHPGMDVDGDCIVDVSDLVIVATAFGTSGEGLSADVNGDNKVNILDLILVAAHFGETTNSSAPSATQMPGSLHTKMLEKCLREARVANDGSEVFRSGIAVLERLLNSIVPQQTALFANYPNPFNPDTWIPYQLSRASDVSVTIYDTTGRTIRQLILGYKPAGVYRTQDRAAYWDGRNEVGEPVASGVYFVALKAGEYQQTRRVVLIK